MKLHSYAHHQYVHLMMEFYLCRQVMNGLQDMLPTTRDGQYFDYAYRSERILDAIDDLWYCK